MAPKTRTKVPLLLRQAAALVQTRLGAAKAAPAVGFLKRLYNRASADDLRDADAESIVGAALELWKFSAKRKPGADLVRVYAPDRKRAGKSARPALQVVTGDMPFVIDSITETLATAGIRVHLLLSTVTEVKRDGSGTRGEPGRAQRETFLHLELAGVAGPKAAAALEKGTRATLVDVAAATFEWQPMREEVESAIEGLRAAPVQRRPDEVREAIAFLQWVLEGNFTLLGYRAYAVKTAGKKAVTTDGQTRSRRSPQSRHRGAGG